MLFDVVDPGPSNTLNRVPFFFESDNSMLATEAQFVIQCPFVVVKQFFVGAQNQSASGMPADHHWFLEGTDALKRDSLGQFCRRSRRFDQVQTHALYFDDTTTSSTGHPTWAGK